MAAEHISAHNLDAFFRYLSERTGRDATPVGGTAAWKGLSEEALADKLWAHYEAMGIPPNRGVSIARQFLESGAGDVREDEVADIPPASFSALSTPTSTGRTRYERVDPAIGTENYRQFLRWIAAQTGVTLPAGLPEKWAGFNSINIRASLPEAYAAMGIGPDAAKDFEAEFVRGAASAAPAVGGTTVGSAASAAAAVTEVPIARANPIPVVPPPIPTAPIPPQPTPPAYRAPQPAQPRPYAPAPRRRSRGIVRAIGILLLLAVLGTGAWAGLKYREWASLPTVYPLADNVSLRNGPFDGATSVGRLDLFGRFAEKNGTVGTSLSRLKLLSAEPENSYYRATPSPSFFEFLTGNDEAVYVHSKYVTQDGEQFEAFQRVLAPLADDINAMDKLPFAYRRLLVSAFERSPELQGQSLAQSCKPSAVLAKDAPIPVATYKARSSGEISAVFFTADGRAFVATGLDAEAVSTPRVRPVVLDEGGQLMGPGMFRRGSGGSLLYVPCNSAPAGLPVLGKPPYTAFYTQYPVSVPTADTALAPLAPTLPDPAGATPDGL